MGWITLARAAIIYKILGADALDAWLTNLRMKWLGKRSRLTEEQKSEAGALLERIRQRHNI